MGWSVCVDPIPYSQGQGGSVAHCGNKDLEICIPKCNLESRVIGGYMCVNAMWVGESRCVVTSTTTPEKEILRDARTGCDNETRVGRARCMASRTATIHPTDATTSKCSNLTLLSFKTCNKAPLPTIERGSIADYNAYDNCYQVALDELDRCMGLTATVSRDGIAPPLKYPASALLRIEYDDDDAILRNEDASDACDKVSFDAMTACRASLNTTSADDGGTSTNEGLEYDVCYNVSMAARDRCIELRKTMQPVTPRGVVEPASRRVRNTRSENGSTTIIIVNQRLYDDDDDYDPNTDRRNRGTSWAIILSIIIPIMLLSVCCVYLYIPFQQTPASPKSNVLL